jgi:hypothetical protein
MRKVLILPFIIGSLCTSMLRAQKAIDLNVKNTTPVYCRAEFRGDTIHLVNQSDKTALVWLNDVNFKNGIIELYVKGKDVRGESFLGVALHGIDDSTYSAIYFRPFNFNSSDRRSHSVQYIDLPGNDWDLLREKFPDKYEGSVYSVPNANDWFHTKIVVEFPMISVFVNNSIEP